MSRSTIFGQPVVPRLVTLLEDVEHGVIEVPRFQRPFVWKDSQRLKLMDSISRGMPIGSLLVWRSSTIDLATYPNIGPFTIKKKTRQEGTRTYLLDGHQRLSTLYGALRPLSQATSSNDGERQRWPIYYNLGANADDNAFCLQSHSDTPSLEWLPLSLLLNPIELFNYQKKLIEKGHPEHAKEVERLANVFKDYLVPVIPIEGEDLDAITESFSRVNSQGTPMSEVHMLEALTHSAEFDLETKLDDVQTQLSALGWGDITHQTLINTLKVGWGLNIHKAGPEKVAQYLRDAPDAVDRLFGTITAAIRLLNAAGVYGWNALPSVNQLVALAEAARVGKTLTKPATLRQAFVKWVHATTYGNYFTGKRSNDFDRAMKHLSTVLTNPTGWRPPDLVDETSLTTKFNAGSVRGLGLAGLMARTADSIDKNHTSHQRLFGQLGSKAILKMVPNCPATELGNRIVIHFEQLKSLQDALATQTLSAAEGRRYAISPDAAEAYAHKHYDEFVTLRGRALRALERAELLRLGFTVTE